MLEDLDHEDTNGNVDDGEVENKPKRFKSEFYNEPTAAEMYNLKNTENLYQSNLFRLQLSELINELNLPEQKLKSYNLIIKDLIKALKGFKTLKDLKFANLKEFEKENYQLPMSDLCKKMEGTYSFIAPTEVNTIGSFATNSSLKTSKITIDLSVEIPAEVFTERDYLNYRYFIKRNLFMGNVYLQLIKNKKYSNLKYEFIATHGSINKPLLALDFEAESLEVRLHFVPNKSTFKIHRFNPNQNNVRREWFAKNFPNEIQFESDQIKEDDSKSDPNPLYNFDILADLTAAENNQYILSKIGVSKELADSVKLLKLWLFKRGLGHAHGGMDSFTLSMFIAYLIQNRQINPLMSQYQIFRIVLLALSDANWTNKGISLNELINKADSSKSQDEHRLNKEDFHKYYQVVFIDPTGYLNLTSKMTKYTFNRLKHEADIGLKLLDNETHDYFDELFINNHSMDIVFDNLISVNPNLNPGFYRDIIKKQNLNSQIKLLDHFNNYFTVASNLIVDLINKSLEHRSSLIFVKLNSEVRWSVDHIKYTNTDEPSIVVGILFNDKYDSVLIKGPDSTSSDAIEFRNFWGSKSQLRRFQDTSICEAVYFECADISQKRLVYAEIIKHVLPLHLPTVTEGNIKFVDRQLNSLLSLPNGVIEKYGTGEERLGDTLRIYDDFSKIIKNLKDMPLLINNLSGTSSVFRLSDVFAPLPSCFKYDKKSEKNMRVKLDQKYLPRYPLGPVMPPYVKPIEVMCQLESSGKWPDDLACIKRLKTAFYLKIVQQLRENHGLVAYTNINYCDVLYKGFVFRIIICTMNELLCMKSYKNELGIIMTQETKETVAYEKRMIYLPKLNSVLHGLQLKNNCYSGVCRLAKRWLSSQFLMEYFEEETIDLICAYIFVQRTSYEPPKSILTGFLRFLNLIANFDWKNQLLLINLNSDLKKDQIVDIQVKFQENRSSLPPVYIVTPYDPTDKNSIWTIEKPTMSELCRTVILAKQSLSKLKSSIMNFESPEHFKDIFRPNCDMFDVTINLKASYCVKAFQMVDICKGTFIPHYRDFNEIENDKTFPVVDFDPVRMYVKELREAYDEIALFFHDVYGSTKIHVLWKPDALKNKELKISNVNYRLIDTIDNNLELNIQAILDDFKIIGKDLVESVVLKSDNSFFKNK